MQKGSTDRGPTSALNRNSRRKKMEENRNLAKLTRPINGGRGLCRDCVHTGSKVHLPERNALSFPRDASGSSGTCKHCKVGAYCTYWAERKGLSPTSAEWANIHMYLVTTPSSLHRRHQLLLLRGQTTTQNKTQTNVVCGRSRCIMELI